CSRDRCLHASWRAGLPPLPGRPGLPRPPSAGLLGGCRRLAAGEVEDPPPGVLTGGRVLLERAVEEAVRRIRIGVRLVFDAGLPEQLFELPEVVRGRGLVLPRQQQQERRLQLRDHRLQAQRLAAIKADRAGEPVALGGLPPGGPAAHAETDGEDRLAVAARLAAEVFNRGSHVTRRALRSQLLYVRHAVESFAPVLGRGGATEVVDCGRLKAGLSEPSGQVFVTLVEDG